MILAAVLRNYKCYKGINIIPFTSDISNSLNMIIGANGVGKSGILESFDTLFNNASWIINNESGKKTDSAVGALFLLKKSDIKQILDSKDLDIITTASNYFWNINLDSNTTLKSYEPIKQIINNITVNKDEYYLLLIGKTSKDKMFSFLTFTSIIRYKIENTTNIITINKTLEKIISYHSYIYIPVETPVSNFVRLQNQSMQTLMDRDIKNSIVHALEKKRITRKISKNRTRRLSILEIINEQLEEYVSSVEKHIQEADKSYSFKPAYRQSSKLTSTHVTDSIIGSYYAKRIFKKDGKIIDNLSSGEKRVILIDIISAFLLKNKPERELIVAIDEPESSLHISRCYDQFSKINKIATVYNHQLFITTHWYGSLPCLGKGNLIHIDNNSKSSCFDLSNYYEDRKHLPEDIQLKGFFDLASSLLYLYRNSDKTMVLVEGSTDKKYIEYYLDDVELNIIPLGGCSNVKKIYEYLYGPLSNKELFCKNGNREKRNRIICLVDTDIQCAEMSVKSDMKSKLLYIKRIHQVDDDSSMLLNYDDSRRFSTEIEEVLEPKQFYDALNDVINEKGKTSEKEAWEAYVFNDQAKTSRIKGDYSILKENNPSGRDKALDKKLIMHFLNENKNVIATRYTDIPKTGNIPEWLKSLKELAYAKE